MQTEPSKFREVIASVTPHSKKIQEMPKRVTDKTIDTLCQEGLVVKSNPANLISQLRKLHHNPNQVLQLPYEFVTPKEEVEHIIKSLRTRDVINMFSSPILESVVEQLVEFEKSQGRDVVLPESYLNARYKRMTARLAKEIRLYPYYLTKEGFAQLGRGAAPIACMWYGTDKRARALSFFREFEAAVMLAAHMRGELEVEFPDKKFYGRNIRVRIESHGKEEEDVHQFTMTNLSIFKKEDKRQHYHWIDTEGSCNCADKGFTSRLHDKRARSTGVSCKHEILAYLAAMRYLTKTRQLGSKYHFRINPFGIPQKQLAKLMETVLTRTFIEKRTPNKTELSRVIGAYGNDAGYDAAFYNWSKRDESGRPRPSLKEYL